MTKELLRIEGLSARVEDKEILKGIDLKINYGEVHVLMGPNGSGKSTIANVIMNNPVYDVTGGDIYLDGENINDLTTDERARRGLFMSFQNPNEVEGVSVSNFIRTAINSGEGQDLGVLDFTRKLHKEMDKLDFDPSYGDRYLNVGFSGGEKKKNEILQMLMLDPKLAILDETDSGLDVDAIQIFSQGIERFLDEDKAVLIITHHRELIRNIQPDKVHIILDGEIVTRGGEDLIHRVEEEGFGWLRERD